MVGFLRKKKSDKVMLGDDTILERKGRIDGASLLDDDGEPTNGTLYDQNNALRKGARNYDDAENNAPPSMPTQPQHFPPQNYPYGQTYPPQQGYGYPQQQQQPQRVGAFGQPTNSYGGNNAYGHNPNSGIMAFANNNRGSLGQQPQQQQYPQQYGNQGQYPPQQQQYPQQYGNQPQQYPQQYGNYPPPFQPQAQKKSSFFRIPGYSKK